MSPTGNTSETGKTLEKKVKTLQYKVNADDFFEMVIDWIANKGNGEDLLASVKEKWDDLQPEARPPYAKDIGKEEEIHIVEIHEVKAFMDWGRLRSKLQYYNDKWGLKIPRMSLKGNTLKEEASRLQDKFQKRIKEAIKNAK